MVLIGGQHTLTTLPLCFTPTPPTEDTVEGTLCLGDSLAESLWKAPEAHTLRTLTFIKWLAPFFLSLYYRHDIITRFINSLLQGLPISQCDGLMHITLTLASGALPPPPPRDLSRCKNTTFPFVSIWICFPSPHSVFPFCLSSTQQAPVLKQRSACVIYSLVLSGLVFHFPPSHIFLRPRRVRGDVWTIYFPLYLPSLQRSTNHHSRCQEFYQDPGAGLKRAQRHMVLTLDPGSGGHFIFWWEKRTGREYDGHMSSGTTVLSSHLLT